MHRKRCVRFVAGIVAAPLLVGGCRPDPTAPGEPLNVAGSPAAVAARMSGTGDAAIAIEDALTRLLGSFDPVTSALLKGPLTAVDAALKNGNGAALAGAIAIARQALTQPGVLNDDRAADLTAISLALDAAASGQ